MNKKFADPHADVQTFVKQWESESRDVYVKRHDILRAVACGPATRVADIGAGTGLFTFLFAEQVGTKSTVYAVDIAPAFVKYITEQAARVAVGPPDRWPGPRSASISWLHPPAPTNRGRQPR